MSHGKYFSKSCNFGYEIVFRFDEVLLTWGKKSCNGKVLKFQKKFGNSFGNLSNIYPSFRQYKPQARGKGVQNFYVLFNLGVFISTKNQNFSGILFEISKLFQSTIFFFKFQKLFYRQSSHC